MLRFVKFRHFPGSVEMDGCYVCVWEVARTSTR